MTLVERLEKSVSFWFLLVISFIFFLLRFPSLFEPYWYGDEGVYQVIALILQEGGRLYTDSWDNKPPFLFIIYYLLSGDQFLVRLTSLIFGSISIVFFYFLSKKLLGQKISILTTVFFAFFLATPLIEGNVANTENFMVFPITLAIFLFSSFIKNRRKFKFLYVSSFILGIAFLFKIVAIFDYLSIFTFLLLTQIESKFSLIKLIKNSNIFIKSVFSFIFLTIPVSLYFLVDGNFRDFIDAFLLKNFAYVNYKNQLIIPQGLLIVKVIILVLFIFLLYKIRNRLKREYLFILIWLSFSLFNTFFSHRPYTHYLLTLLPSFSLLLGLILYDKINRLRFLILFLGTTLIVLSYFTLYPKSFSYYLNFMNFLTGKKTLYEYRAFFDKNTPRDYEISNFIKKNTKESDNIYLWGDNTQVYSLARKTPPGRYSANYYIFFYKDGFKNTTIGLAKERPKYVIIMPVNEAYPFSLSNYKLTINIMGADIYERVN